MEIADPQNQAVTLLKVSGTFPLSASARRQKRQRFADRSRIRRRCGGKKSRTTRTSPIGSFVYLILLVIDPLPFPLCVWIA
jgi:hypothetical protein